MIRVLVVGNHAVVREGLRALIQATPDLEPLGEAVNGMDAADKARALHPDVTLVDLAMPRDEGLQTISRIARDDPGARILALANLADDEGALLAVRAGARGYVSKDARPAELLQAILDLGERRLAASPAAAHGPG